MSKRIFMSNEHATVIDLVTGRKRPAFARPPAKSSPLSSCEGVRVEQFDEGPVEFENEAPLHHIVLVQLDRPAMREWKENGRYRTIHVPPGHVSVFPAMAPCTSRNRDTREFIRVALQPSFVLCASHDVIQSERLELIVRQSVEDPLVRGLALSLMAEVEAGHVGGLWYRESLAHALAVHLVRNYSAQPSASRPNRGGLTRVQLRRAIEFINERLMEEVPIGILAAAVGLSPYHFARLFKQSTGFAPHQYLIQRRVERAKELLIRSDASISQLALQFGFCDQSHFARHFKRIYGVPPNVFLQRFAPRRDPR